jgi:lactoylglutathione lyase
MVRIHLPPAVSQRTIGSRNTRSSSHSNFTFFGRSRSRPRFRSAADYSKNKSIEERRSQWPRPSQIGQVDHIGIRVRNLDRALAFYRGLGFDLVRRAEGDDVAIIRNEHGVELNLIFNANAGDPATNILMSDKFPGYTHIALRVASIPATIAALKANDIAITQGPVSFGESRQVSVFVRDPDRNVIELRGREQGIVDGVTRYVP